MARWTRRQVEQLAPDDSSVKAARKLAAPGPWSDAGATESLVWGKCQGSGKSPYLVSVDLSGPAFKCSCPSRKFPCKHGLALLMLWADGGGSVAAIDAAPDYAADWAAGRAARASGRTARADTPPDPEAQARRLERRLAKMDDGIADFELWLLDLARHGLASARAQPAAYWERAASRLVDAQLPGLADRVRAAARTIVAGDHWAEGLLAEVARWYLAARGWRHRASLGDDLAGDLRAYLGWARPSAEVLEAGERLAGPWTVLGVSVDDTGRLLAQRTWLRSATGVSALMLDFAAAGGSFGVAQVVGSVVDAELAAYPGSEPARVMLAGPHRVTGNGGAPIGEPIAGNLERVAGWLAANPFAAVLPMSLGQVALRQAGDEFLLVDEAGDGVPLAGDPWPVVAQCASGPVDVFGEWDGRRLRPLTVSAGDGLVSL